MHFAVDGLLKTKGLFDSKNRFVESPFVQLSGLAGSVPAAPDAIVRRSVL
jgi:hypothetical protein